MFKVIKKFIYILLSVVAILFLFFIGCYVALKVDMVQKKVLNVVTSSLSQKVDSKVSINSIEWNFPNSFILNDVYIEDQSKDTLLSIKRTKVTILMRELFRRHVSFRTIQMKGMYANITKDSSDTFNYQFFIDAFRKEDKDTSNIKWDMNVESLAFDSCTLKYTNANKPIIRDKFDPNHIFVTNLNGDLYVKCFTPDSSNIKLKQISFKEKSGLELTKLSTTYIANKEKINLYDFATLLPNSKLLLSDATIYHNNYKAFKHFTDSVKFDLSIAPSKIDLKDLEALAPNLHKFKDNFSIECDIEGTVADISIPYINVKYGDLAKFRGSLSAKGLPKIEETNINAIIEEISAKPEDIEKIASSFADKEVNLPSTLEKLEFITYNGKIAGKLTDLKSNGTIASEIGFINNDIHITADSPKFENFNINGSIDSRDLELSKIFEDRENWGKASFSLSINAEKKKDEDISLAAKGNVMSFTYKKYTYNDIILNGTFIKRTFNGNIKIDDENIKLDFDGFVDLNKENTILNFYTNLEMAKLDALNLSSSPNSLLSLEIECNLEGNKLDMMNGNLSLDNLVLKKDNKETVINNVSISSTSDKKSNSRNIKIYSDYVNGEINGAIKYSSIYKKMKNLVAIYLPTLIKKEELEKEDNKNDFTFKFEVENSEPLTDIFKLPIVFMDQSTITGFFNDSINKAKVRIESPLIRIGKNNIADCILLAENPQNKLKLMLRGTNRPNSSRRNPYFITLSANAKNDSIETQFNFCNSMENTYSGQLSFSTIIREKTKEGITADFFIRPTEFILNDVTWEMHESHLKLSPNKLEVNGFYFNHSNQNLRINGVSTNTTSDSMLVHFSDLHLDYISDILNAHGITFDGVANGDIFLYKLFDKPYYVGDLNIYDAAINDYIIGDLSVKSDWDEKRKCISFITTLDDQKDNNYTAHSDIFGGVFVGNDSLYIEGDLHDVDLKFLRKYIGSVMQNNTGTASGKIKAYGKFKDIGIEGVAYAKDFAFDIDFLKTSYTLSDSIYLSRNSIKLNQTTIYDKEGNIGIANAIVLHEAFRNFKFAVDLNCKNILALNTTEQDNESFFGKAYASGNVTISGTPNEVNFGINVKSMPQTKITIPVGTYANANSSDFITFVENADRFSADKIRKQRRTRIRKIEENKKSKTKINLDINIEATKDAIVQLIMDPRQGDMIKGNGNGKIHINYSTKESGMQMYGSYEILKGEYFFTIQSLISRKFEINEGSLVRWTGSPYNAILDINAKYALNTSLTEILDDPNLRSTLTPVNCLLNLTGTINKPIIKFDINLPTADSDLTSRLKSVINTEELMNRNIASLLALGHFYTMDKKKETSSTNELSSVGFSTLSAQVSNWISSIDDGFNVGLNYKPSDGVSTSNEFDVALSTQLLNDRLLLNGNFGYREDKLNTARTNNSIVDFDIEYKLTPNGKYRLKAFNRTNDSYFKQAPNTQGVGIIYREEFDTFGDLFKSYYQPFGKWLNATKKEEKDSTQTDGIDSLNVRKTKQ